ncbi:MAG: FliH/SctL family protein [Myxococcota bacterium]|jgi:flagellar biosynthesis/type III secretory pathway protein FliH|nr:FliH/SctL family protein [Myxococcota bacterium]
MSSFEPQPFLAAAAEFESKRDVANPAGFVPLRVGEERPADEAPAAASEEEIKAAAWKEGFAAGRAELPWQEAETLQGLIETLEKALEGVSRLRRGLLEESRETSVELALAMAECLVRRQIALDPAPLVDIVKRALETLPDEPKLRVALASEDFECLQLGLAEELASFGASGAVALEASADLASGDVRVEGERGGVDARLTTVLSRMRDGLDGLRDMPEADASAEPESLDTLQGDTSEDAEDAS